MAKRLYRSRSDRMLAGVAGGLAEYFDVDVVLIRLLILLSVILGGGGLVAYIIAWIVIPEEGAPSRQPFGETEPDAGDKDEERVSPTRNRNLGLLLVALGVIFLADNVLPLRILHNLWPVFLILLGAFLITREQK